MGPAFKGLGSSGTIPVFEKFHFDSLHRIDVSVAGDWQADRPRDWRGLALASEPLVAISFVAEGGQVSWCKSERPNPLGQPVRLLLGHHDSGMRDLQVNFSVGGGQVVSRTVVESPTYRPKIQTTMNLATASLIPFATVEGSHPVELFALFVAGADVKVGRNGLWRLRSELVESVPANFRELLTHGRTGDWAVAT